MKKTTSLIYKFQTKGYFNNGLRSNSILFDRRHNNLRVISTPEFPVPYYQRIMRAPAAPERVSLNLMDINSPVDDVYVIKTKEKLAKCPEGLKVLDFVENKVHLKSYETKIESVSTQANIYADDLINYIDAAHEENNKILKQVSLADCLK